MNLIRNKLHLISNINVMKILSRNISVSAVNRLKEIKHTEKDNTITVEAVKVVSDRRDQLVTKTHTHKDCCPLCRLNLRRLDYTDVLILRQFIESNGKQMPQSITGLCNRMHQRVHQLVKKAQKCQLLPRPPDYQSYGPWDELNTYYEWPERRRDRPMDIIEPKFWASDYEQNKL
ncbi:unnamed protein product [Medioppia subpectinata]|uniref:28S ribosomal protein S18a, mitochondrial n=1 Tax=Medioppia subpectinata TaxID=1979941 RepID=A0A7R9QES6_9ACAR|nr:unnamed protein product [Medioppia subpectinata]CAG2119455.1 unnamed protein product [Medioppia subpectinata]